MEREELGAAIEAILFASGDPLPIEKISDILQVTKPLVEEVMQSLIDKFDQKSSGIQIVMLNQAYQMCSKPQYGNYIRDLLDMKKNASLSSAAMEVLSIIAYHQPVTKAFIDQVRGVDCGGVLTTLSHKNLVEERGRLELPGRPLLYGTTLEFLRCFGLSQISDLPPLPNIKKELRR